MANRRKKINTKLKTRTLGDILDTEFPVRDYIIAPWLKEGESAMVYAQAGVGKSMFTLSLALSIAGGGEVMGWKSPKPYRVLFVDGEMHIDDIQSRSRMLMETVHGLDVGAARENLMMLARQDQNANAKFPDLAEQAGRDFLIGYIQERKPDLVILDNLSTLATIEDENSAGQFNDVVTFLMKLKQLNKACILVHHSNKGGRSFRGSTKLATTFEVILGLHQLTGSKAQHGTAFTMEWDKYRGERDGTTIARDLWLTKAGEGDDDEAAAKPIWTSEVSANEEIVILLEALRSMEYGNQKDLALALGWSPAKVTRLKGKAIGEGRINGRQWNDLLMEARELHEEENPDY